MKTIVCDICGAALKTEVLPGSLSATATLLQPSGNHVDGVALRSFDFKIALLQWRFPTDNFHVCDLCLVAAIGRCFQPAEKLSVETVEVKAA